MSSYVIVGSSDKFDTSECENLANQIRTFYPDISFKVVLKDLSEWEQYIDEICRIYGFKIKTNPIIFTIDGKLIGDRNAFVLLAETRFGISNPKLRQGPVTPDINKKQARIALDQKIKESKNKRTLQEKIEEETLHVFVQGFVKPVEGFYQKKFVDGMNFFVKREERLCPSFQLQRQYEQNEIQQQVEEEFTVLMQVTNAEGKSEMKPVPMFNDRFITIEYQQFLLQLNQSNDPNLNSTDKLPNSQRAQSILVDPSTLQNWNSSAQRLQQTQQDEKEGDPIVDQSQTQLQDGENNQLQDGELGDQFLEGEVQDIRPETAPLQIESGEEKPDIIQLNKFLIHKFRSNYGLFAHPFPLMEGQYILAKPILRPGQLPSDPLNLFIEDYSRIQRGRFNSFKATLKSNINTSSADQTKVEGLYNNALDIYRSITLDDCDAIVKLITKVDAIISLNILPQELKSFLPLSNGHINVILRKFALLQAKNEHLLPYLEGKSENKKAPSSSDPKQYLPLEEFILDQKSRCYLVGKNVYQLKGLDIIHYIGFPEKVLTGEQTLANITQLIAKHLEKEPNAALKMGYNLVISKYLIFLAPTFTHYDSINQTPLHLPVFASLGFENLPLDKINTNNSNFAYFQNLREKQPQMDKPTLA